jgi:Fuc2NAc and GlcNAc transferase
VPVVLAAQLLVGLLPGVDLLPTLVVSVSGGILAVLGWCDDRKPLRTRLRLLVQFTLASVSCVALWALIAPVDASRWWLGLLVPAMVWFINLYNFMDGSDGMAGSQALVGGIGLAALAAGGGLPGIALPALVMAGASLGFLYWNWSPARIFLGDAGSYFMGGMFALWIAQGLISGRPPWPWAMLFVPFVTDTTLTLLARMCRGDRWWQAHREHAYQRLVLRGWSHRSAALAYAGFSVALWPLAWLAGVPTAGPGKLALLAYALAATMWYLIRLGDRRKAPT